MRTASAFEETILSLIDEPLTHAGYYIVLLKLMDGKKKKTLELTAERVDGEPMGVEDCEAISTTASALLDVHDPIESAYDLEVSSPGLERPLTVLADFETYKGEVASVELNMAKNGRKRFKGAISAVEGEDITIDIDEESFILPFSAMRSASLVATDAMIRKLLADQELNDAETKGSRRFGKKKKERSSSEAVAQTQTDTTTN